MYICTFIHYYIIIIIYIHYWDKAETQNNNAKHSPTTKACFKERDNHTQYKSCWRCDLLESLGIPLLQGLFGNCICFFLSSTMLQSLCFNISWEDFFVEKTSEIQIFLTFRFATIVNTEKETYLYVLYDGYQYSWN